MKDLNIFFFFLIGAVVIFEKFGRDQRQGRRYLFRSNSAYETDQSLSTHKYPLRSDNSKFPRYLGYTPSSQHSSERAQQRLWEIYSTRQWHGEKDEASTAVNREETGWKGGEGGGGDNCSSISLRSFSRVIAPDRINFPCRLPFSFATPLTRPRGSPKENPRYFVHLRNLLFSFG